jgi:hypothetical protein
MGHGAVNSTTLFVGSRLAQTAIGRCNRCHDSDVASPIGLVHRSHFAGPRRPPRTDLRTSTNRAQVGATRAGIHIPLARVALYFDHTSCAS